MQIQTHSSGNRAGKESLRYKIACLMILFFSMVWCGLILGVPFLSGGSLFMQRGAALIRLFFSPICHQLPDRSFHLAGKALPVCARCAGIYGGFLAGVFILAMTDRLKRVWIPGRWFMVSGLTMTGLEVLLSHLGLFSSTLMTRCLTGALLGSVVSVYVLAAVYQTINYGRNEEVKKWKELRVNSIRH